mmetsp:Transcript_106656/g.301691  ORF Transcript_106656/g.301691 Transcript_106656/m.301691 type:complete len:305 (+) Transcript_106656:811-1725(+)
MQSLGVPLEDALIWCLLSLVGNGLLRALQQVAALQQRHKEKTQVVRRRLPGVDDEDNRGPAELLQQLSLPLDILLGSPSEPPRVDLLKRKVLPVLEALRLVDDSCGASAHGLKQQVLVAEAPAEGLLDHAPQAVQGQRVHKVLADAPLPQPLADLSLPSSKQLPTDLLELVCLAHEYHNDALLRPLRWQHPVQPNRSHQDYAHEGLVMHSVRGLRVVRRQGVGAPVLALAAGPAVQERPGRAAAVGFTARPPAGQAVSRRLADGRLCRGEVPECLAGVLQDPAEALELVAQVISPLHHEEGHTV